VDCHFARQFPGRILQALCQDDREGLIKAGSQAGKRFEQLTQLLRLYFIYFDFSIFGDDGGAGAAFFEKSDITADVIGAERRDHRPGIGSGEFDGGL